MRLQEHNHEWWQAYAEELKVILQSEALLNTSLNRENKELKAKVMESELFEKQVTYCLKVKNHTILTAKQALEKIQEYSSSYDTARGMGKAVAEVCKEALEKIESR